MMLQNQTAIVTGSGRGVGRAVAKLLAEQGANVIISDLDQEHANSVVTEIIEKGGHAVSFPGDVTSDHFAENIIETAVTTFGGLDILVNNAGYTWDGLIHKMSDKQFQAMLDIHLIAPFKLIRAAAPHMRKEVGSEIYRKIVNVSSVAGVMGNIGQANYAAAKAGLIGLTKTVAKEWGAYNVNCNAVAFGLIDTRLTQSKEKGESFNGVSLGIPEKVRKMFEHSIPQQRAGTPEEAASAILYLASPLANYVNGQVLHINGGMYT
ncbi:3-oxoacyl-ACP reductase [Heyndrickxia sporothermodurans]|uniref:SDR family oxidoreductase n=1 Tax=Heyndrickxia sporothermodurans TaxID=46224 RepID=A0AB37H7F9_9BACI|nr:SDR family NAD(P)-dependent oxidoreductase [Heyndrickxia sporothermodurans]MBL5766902.1 SDR family oxidoreductase [Heyndrickxia sporothermodurans]MBL5771548.1 SDR family oxidoreductase [Heyndrickxia sporothermodurans]MBL5773890.1 SDR family oxidoreductase [Heyndrickxia sporothermodurans]MBL5778279.1 SDR family oxidoreductase [Heyndrickxia sporothermodurans]MBL5780895.1 SDR family oxidoreductase [Heyndrickxia sporothermodurans]